MPTVAIVGRPNVGKSTLFNRLTGERQAIVHDQPGVTRDRVYGNVFWTGRTFSLIDTGGFVPRSADRFEKAIREQVHIALEEADLILFVVDVETGITDLDQEIANMLRRTEKPVMVVANKADNEERRWEASAFYELGLGEVYALSATNSIGTGDMLDALLADLPTDEEEKREDHRVRLAVIGRPNVGKSQLVNRLLGQERSIVTEVSGTTRDAIHSMLEHEGREIVLVDTAGLRKKARVKENVEFYSTLRTERAIRGCDVAVLLLDATRGLENQDMKVIQKAEQEKKGLLIAINKWDLVAPDAATAQDYKELIRWNLKTMDHVPIMTISALTGKRTQHMLDRVLEIAERRRQHISTSTLNGVVQEAVKRHVPPTYRGNPVRIKYATQAETGPPVFVFFCNHPQGVKQSYKRYLERQLREAFDLEGVPVILVFKEK